MTSRIPALLPLTICFGITSSLSAIAATPVTALMEATSPSGQDLSLRVTVDDATTTFELTGPDYSFFAFGFNTTTMFGYSLIVEGLDATRTVVEQNLQGLGNPGSPQANQNITLLNTMHDSAQNLTTLIVERPNNTGDPNDPVFSTSMTNLPVIWAYNSFASPEAPSPMLDFHGGDGRGFGSLSFQPVPEPAALTLLLSATATAVSLFRTRSGR